MSELLNRRRLLRDVGCIGVGAFLSCLVGRGPTPAPAGRAEAAQEDTKDGPESRVKKLKLELPRPIAPKGATLVSAVRVGELLYVSGHGPGQNNGKAIVGKVGKDMTEDQAKDAARRTGLIILGVVRAHLGSLDKVVRLVKTLGMVNCTPEFIRQPAVINGFSDLMVEVFGDNAGKGARSAVGMASLPGGIPVEVECIFQVK